MNDKANKERALELCCEYIEKSAKMMNDAILCISALENDDDIQECIAKVVSCFNVSIEFVVASVNSHRNGGHACGECKNYGNKLPLKCAYRGVNHPACAEFEQKVMFIPDTPETREQASKVAEILRDAEIVPVVTEKAEPKNKTCNDCEHYDFPIHYCSYKKDVVFMQDVCFCEEFKPAHDAVSHPSHYCRGGVECLDAIKAALGDKYEGFLAGNVLKYVYRYPDKNGVEDCRKAAFYLDKLIKELSDEK